MIGGFNNVRFLTYNQDGERLDVLNFGSDRTFNISSNVKYMIIYKSAAESLPSNIHFKITDESDNIIFEYKS